MKKGLPIVLIVGFVLATAISAGATRSGQAIYEKHCSMCHATGVAGAPKFGDAEAWKKHLAEGDIDHLVEVAKKGEGAMPPMGTCNDCTMEELEAAVRYMVDNSK